MSYKQRLGSILIESETIAFDSVRGMFFNPKTKTDYGTSPPAGGWPISWFSDDAGNIIVPLAPGGVAKNASEAATMKTQIAQQLAQQGMMSQQVANQQIQNSTPVTNATITNANSTTTTTTQLQAVVPDNKWLVYGAVALGAWFLFFRGRR